MDEAREEFNRRWEEIRRECEPARGEPRRGMESDFTAAFEASPLFTHVKLKRSAEPDYHLRVFATASPKATVSELEAELRRIWLEELRHNPGEEAHVLERGARSLVLDGVTAPALGEYYLSTRVRVEDVPLEEAPAPDGTDPYLVALFGGGSMEDGEEGHAEVEGDDLRQD